MVLFGARRYGFVWKYDILLRYTSHRLMVPVCGRNNMIFLTKRLCMFKYLGVSKIRCVCVCRFLGICVYISHMNFRFFKGVADGCSPLANPVKTYIHIVDGWVPFSPMVSPCCCWLCTIVIDMLPGVIATHLHLNIPCFVPFHLADCSSIEWLSFIPHN